MQHALVTGGSGFIGRHLVAKLIDDGVRVTCFVRPSSRTDHLTGIGANIVTGALDNLDDVRPCASEVDTVFHVAGLTHAISNQQLRHVNGTTCGVIADACRSAPNPPRLVCVSSLSAAGPSEVDGPPIDESMSPHPISNYGESKRLGEIEIQKRAGDVPCSVIRPGIVFGPHDPGIVSIMQPIHRFGVHMVVGFRTPALSMIYVDDLVRLLLTTADQGERLRGDRQGEYSSQGYYFACDDSEHPTYHELGRRIAEVLDRRVLVWPLWRFVGRALGSSCELANRLRGKSGLLNRDKITEGTASGWACSASKARGDLGFAPAQDLTAALRKTATWYLHGETSASPAS